MGSEAVGPSELRRRHIAELFAETHQVGEMRELESAIETFPAIERQTGDRVEIRTLIEEMDEASCHRFRRNIPFAASFTHPGIQRVRDHGLRGDTTFFIVDALVGESLRDRMQREGQLPVPDALRIARECAEALSHIHEHKCVVRDLSPNMIVLCADRATLTADAGMSVCFFGPEDHHAVGNPAYQSPEFISGQRAGATSDIYTLGAILYGMLTGAFPFPGDSMVEVMEGILLAPRPCPSAIRPVSPAVDELVTRAMAVDPEDRFQSAAEFAEALSRVA